MLHAASGLILGCGALRFKTRCGNAADVSLLSVFARLSNPAAKSSSILIPHRTILPICRIDFILTRLVPLLGSRRVPCSSFFSFYPRLPLPCRLSQHPLSCLPPTALLLLLFNAVSYFLPCSVSRHPGALLSRRVFLLSVFDPLPRSRPLLL